MFEITITKKINFKNKIKLMNFLFDLSSEISFSSFHNYHLNEEDANHLLNEYKKRCIEKHHKLKELYQNQDKILTKTLLKLKINTEEEFEDYQTEIFQNDLSLCKKMEKVFEKLQENLETRNYQHIFPQLAKDYKNFEMHMFDVVSTSLIPIDIIVYHLSKEILELMYQLPSLQAPVLIDKTQQIYYINPVFYDDEDGFAAIFTDTGIVSMVLTETEYKGFKKLKIKHKKEVIDNE